MGGTGASSGSSGSSAKGGAGGASVDSGGSIGGAGASSGSSGSSAKGGAGGAPSGGSGGGTGKGGSGGTTSTVPDKPGPKTNFTEQVGSVPFDMVYVPGGTFTLGCESGSCPQYTDPVADVKVSSYYIGKTEVTTALWNAVMGTSSSGIGGTGGSMTSITWYNAMEFACKLGQMTGRKYRMPTEAEWEYAAKKQLSSLEKVGTGEEWAYNSWETAYSCKSGAVDPVGPGSGQHTQKTRRDAQGTADNITGRLIRSIDGIGPALRLAISDETAFPPTYVSPCDLHAPAMGSEPVNSYRDPRWITGSDAHWTTGSIAIGNFDLRVWEDGTARLGTTNGQWFTSNNIAFVFVPSSGAIKKFPYIFLDDTQGSLLSETSFMSGGYIGRIAKEAATSYAKPTVSGLKSGAELAAAAGDDFKMVDMVNIPEAAKKQDPRLLDGPTQGWFQDNRSAGGVHHYRKDVDPDEFRFTVNQGTSRTMLANGKWFTVNNTFLRITHSSGYTTDYLYAVDADGTFYHDSFQAYERADFRMFKKTANGSETFAATCGSICSDEIPKGEKASLYSTLDNGKSTFVPAPCPPEGCK
ncbi:MAG TPA: SUMF1/EgtB/PvdO family nonheme iron enzyme [Polyangiaceae bacterium]|nr:SUMF1/EgtB/PvdO family nonheme iron enzyme [Polyangiaceae bacterium]